MRRLSWLILCAFLALFAFACDTDEVAASAPAVAEKGAGPADQAEPVANETPATDPNPDDADGEKEKDAGVQPTPDE